jgi:hypothetical protein
MLFNLLRKSSKYNSAPAEKAIIAKAISFKKFKFSIAVGVIKFRNEDPAMRPVIMKPVISGNFIFWNNFAIWLAAIATNKNPIVYIKNVFKSKFIGLI